MDYFYTSPDNISNTSVRIDGEEFSHLTHVMRKKTGDIIRVIDGMGAAYDVCLETIARGTATGKILTMLQHHNEPGIDLTLAVGILKNPSKFDFLVEKITELGVKEIIPLLTERTIPSHAKIDRWQKLALAGMKQSGRSYLPIVRELTPLEQFLQSKPRFDALFVAHEKAAGSPTHARQSLRSAIVLIGPEGGFSDDEINRCSQAGFQQLYFGERRLRTETAAIVAATLFTIPS
jgi:16S rRNA (uracil1498-N3)-methyltransferase